MSKELHEQLIFVGFTNGSQILYASDLKHGGEGIFYKDTEGDCYIPLYMLKTHSHRIESTTGGNVTMDAIKGVQKDISEQVTKESTAEPTIRKFRTVAQETTREIE